MQVVSVRDGQGILIYELKQEKRKTHCFPARMQRQRKKTIKIVPTKGLKSAIYLKIWSKTDRNEKIKFM